MVKTIADQFAETLAAAGVKRIHGIASNGLNGSLDSLRRQGEIERVDPRRGGVLDLADKILQRLA